MNIREYKRVDFPAVSEIYASCRKEEFINEKETPNLLPIEDDDKNLSLFRNSDIYVYEGKKIYGFATISDRCISWLYVHPDYRSKGIGSNLLKFILNNYSYPVILNVTKSNINAIRFYKWHGFEITKSFNVLVQGKKVDVIQMRNNG